jgi:hypothetical protein
MKKLVILVVLTAILIGCRSTEAKKKLDDLLVYGRITVAEHKVLCKGNPDLNYMVKLWRKGEINEKTLTEYILDMKSVWMRRAHLL